MTRSVRALLRSPSLIACGLSTAAVLLAIFYAPNFLGERSPIQQDERSYYGYLPALFIHHDIALHYYAADPAAQAPFIEAERTPEGRYVLKMTCGVALFQLPFFLVAHGYSALFGEPTGYSTPYKLMVILSGAFYGCAGLWLLRMLLLRRFSEAVTAAAIASLMLGTNLFHYTYFEAGLSHVYEFFTFVMVVWFTFSWHAQPTVRNSAALGLFCGMAVLTRPSDGLIVLLPLLFGVVSKDTLRGKLLLAAANARLVLLAGLCLLLPNALQMGYWKTATGHWIFYSYIGERFHFSHPHFIEGLFGFRKGWFVYTPIMLLAMAGLYVGRRKLRDMYYPLLLFLLADLYVVFSWWCWWYAGSFGMRALVESYALMAFPLAACYERLFAARRVGTLAVLGVALLIGLNLFQTYQYRERIIDPDSMTRRAYWFVFLRPSLTNAERVRLRTLLEPMDYVAAMHE